MNNAWFVYMIRCENESLYTGSTNHLIRRWNEHIEGKGAKYLRAHKPVKVVFIEKHQDQSTACKREYEIKQFTRQGKEALIKAQHSQ